MSSYEFTTIRDGHRATVIVESASVERAEDILRRRIAPTSVQYVGVVEAPAGAVA